MQCNAMQCNAMQCNVVYVCLYVCMYVIIYVCIAFYCILLYCIVLYFIVLYCIFLYCIVCMYICIFNAWILRNMCKHMICHALSKHRVLQILIVYLSQYYFHTEMWETSFNSRSSKNYCHSPMG